MWSRTGRRLVSRLRRGRTGLLDIDLHGPCIPKLLGLEGRLPGPAPEGLLPVTLVEKLKVMSIGFLLGDDQNHPIIVRGPMKHKLIQQFLTDVVWGELDYLFVDSPPGTGDEPLSTAQLIPGVDGAVIVTTPQEMALTDVRKCIRRNPMKIAVVTDDGKTISRHFGRARQYLVVTVEDGQILHQDLRDKVGHHAFAPHQPSSDVHAGPHGFDPASRNRHAQMLSAIQDCQIVLSGGMGMGMQQNLVEVGIRPVLTGLHDIREAVQAFVEGRLTERPELAH